MYGFLHNDVHFGNFLITKKDDKYQVVIMDFENSLFDLTKNNDLDILYLFFEQILNNILLELNLVTENMEIVLNYIKSNKNKLIDINYLLNLIDNIIMIKKRDLSKRIEYDPNIF
jgi:thiamine kinase-like enzyme